MNAFYGLKRADIGIERNQWRTGDPYAIISSDVSGDLGLQFATERSRKVHLSSRFALAATYIDAAEGENVTRSREELPVILPHEIAADLIRISVRTLRRHLPTGIMPAHRWGRQYTIYRDEWLAWIDSGGALAPIDVSHLLAHTEQNVFVSEEVASLIGAADVKHVRAGFAAGRIPAHRLGRLWLVFRPDFLAAAAASLPEAFRPPVIEFSDPLDGLPELITVTELATYLGRPRETIEDWIAADIVPAHRIVSKKLVPREEFSARLRDLENSYPRAILLNGPATNG